MLEGQLSKCVCMQTQTVVIYKSDCKFPHE